MSKKEFILELMPYFFVCLVLSVIEYNLGWNRGYDAAPTTEQIIDSLTYSQRRDIAIQFMCAEKHWQGMRTFCGNIPPQDGK